MKKFISTTWNLFKFVILVALAAWVIKGALFQPFVVDGISMEPSFHNNEYLLVNKVNFRLRPPQRGEVIIFRAPDKPEYDYIKRVIGLPNETVSVKNGKVYINERELQENYLAAGEKTIVDQDESLTLTRTLGKNEYFVMGDNRDHSTDSREFGIVPKTNLVGKAWLAVYPRDTFGFIPHTNYSFGAY